MQQLSLFAKQMIMWRYSFLHSHNESEKDMTKHWNSWVVMAVIPKEVIAEQVRHIYCFHRVVKKKVIIWSVVFFLLDLNQLFLFSSCLVTLLKWFSCLRTRFIFLQNRSFSLCTSQSLFWHKLKFLNTVVFCVLLFSIY